MCATFLIVILDIYSLFNAKSKEYQYIQTVHSAVKLFCHCFVSTQRHNRLVVLANFKNDTHVLYSGDEIEIVNDIAEVLSKNMAELIESKINDDIPKHQMENLLSKSLSIALCIFNRKCNSQSAQKCITIIQSEAQTRSYNAIMNSIFSAQKLNININALVISKTHSHLLQQACFFTGGVYLKHETILDLPQLLLAHFLSNKNSKGLLSDCPILKSVEFKSTCSCHNRYVQFAYMCSVCLNLSCEEVTICNICDTASRLN